MTTENKALAAFALLDHGATLDDLRAMTEQQLSSFGALLAYWQSLSGNERERRVNPEIKSEWRGVGDQAECWWSINGDWISDGDLRNWCANNIQTVDKHVDVVRLCHVRAYANRRTR